MNDSVLIVVSFMSATHLVLGAYSTITLDPCSADAQPAEVKVFF